MQFSGKSPLRSKASSDTLSAIHTQSSIAWRRQRLLNIQDAADQSIPDTTESPEEEDPLVASAPEIGSYGTITPSSAAPRAHRHPRPEIPRINTRTSSFSAFPALALSLSRESVFNSKRPISAYDPINKAADQVDDSLDDTKLNGVRVWYSSFSSVDWLHDAIKDSTRLWRLRSRKSLRGRIRSMMDRSIDWITISIVGFLSAIVAFIIARSEQWLFGLKEGRCRTAWWRSRQFCDDWEEWSELLDSGVRNPFSWETFGAGAFEYVVYAAIAILLATASAVLTVRLSASPSFISYKDSGVLAPEFDSPIKETAEPHPKRPIIYFAAGSGIPEIKTILSGFVIHGYLGGRTLFTKSVGLTLSVASGLTLGKEGPFVHIACCIGNIISRFFRKYELNEGKRRQILSASAAAGVAVAFGAPIGGVLFSLEEVSYFFPPRVMWQSFFCAMVAAMTLRFLDPFGTGKLVLFQVTYDKDWHAFELVFFMILGVFGGVYGAYFSKFNYRWSRHVRDQTWLKTHPVSEVILVTLATTVLCFLNPYTRMGGTELVYNLFAECGAQTDHDGLCPRDPMSAAGALSLSIGVALIVKGFLTIITFGIKVPAGIFIPTLGVGACFGRILGIWVEYLQIKRPDLPIFSTCGDSKPCVVPGLYAMVGAAATLSGVTRTTVSLAVIMFELTDTLSYVGPVTLAILVAKTVADALEPKGIYDLVIELSRLPYLDSKHEYLWGKMRVTDVMDHRADVIIVDEHNTVRALRDKLQKMLSAGYADSGFPILRHSQGGMRMVGYIGVNELEHALAIVADNPDGICYFNAARQENRVPTSPSVSSLVDMRADADPLDLTPYMDQAPLTVQSYSPLELVQQLFAKLGAKYVIVTDFNGFYEGMIDKDVWLAFLDELDHRS